MQGVFDRVYSEYKNQVYFFVKKYVSNREDLEDVVQEIFVHLWKYKNQLESSSNIEAIIFKSAKQEIASFYRRKKLVFSNIEEIEHTLQSSENPVFNSDVHYELLRTELQTALQSVPSQSRQIFLDHKVNGKSYSIIAKEHGISKSAVEKQVNAVLKYLRSNIKYTIEDMPLSLSLLFFLSLCLYQAKDFVWIRMWQAVWSGRCFSISKV